MSGNWKINGRTDDGLLGYNSPVWAWLPGPPKYEIENTETGEKRDVYTYDKSRIGEKISKGETEPR